MPTKEKKTASAAKNEFIKNAENKSANGTISNGKQSLKSLDSSSVDRVVPAETTNIKVTTQTLPSSKETLASLKVNQPQVDDNKKMVETVRTATRKAAAITAKTTEVKKAATKQALAAMPIVSKKTLAQKTTAKKAAEKATAKHEPAQSVKKLPLAKIILELNAVMNNYPIKQIARMDALRWENEKEQNNQFEEPKIVITETFA